MPEKLMPENPDGQKQIAFQPFEVLGGTHECGLLIIADHARPDLPACLGPQGLGLGKDEMSRHIAYDIGIEGVARGLNQQLGAPVVMSTFSRLLIDPNRGENDPTLVMRLSDGAIVPGNADIDEDGINNRLMTYYRPYHDAITTAIDQFLEKGICPVLLSLHSFTPVWRGRPRDLHAGILWDRDDRFVLPLLAALRADGALIVGDNQPYTGRLKGDCMYRHGTSRGLAHALLEIRQDLIEQADDQAAFAHRLASVLTEVVEDDMLMQPCREIRHFGSLTD